MSKQDEYKQVYLEDYSATVINLKSFEEEAGKLTRKVNAKYTALDRSFALYPCGVCVNHISTLSIDSDHRCSHCHLSFAQRVERFK